MTYIIPAIFGFLFWLSTIPMPSPIKLHSGAFEALANEYTNQYAKVNVPPLEIPWKTNFNAEQKSLATYYEQEKFFNNMNAKLRAINPDHLQTCQFINYEILAYETDLNLRRLILGKQYTEKLPVILQDTELQDTGLSSLPQGRDWYRWYLQKWLTSPIQPDAIMAFGEQEIEKGLAELARLESDIITSGAAPSLAEFIASKSTSYHNQAEILTVFSRKKSRVDKNLAKLFLDYKIAPIAIMPNENPDMSNVPGYYIPPTFFYGWNGTSYRAQDTDYLYLHEGIPGHHFQIEIAAKHKACTYIMPSVFYSAFAEGWAAYVETLGQELGLYDSFETRLGAIDWNLIRSTRVYLDVAINDHGWNDEKATKYWQDKLPPHLHNLSVREIKRMRNWPAQVITYKIGANAILQLKASEQARLGSKFDIRIFHDKLLRMGPVPLSVLEVSYEAMGKLP